MKMLVVVFHYLLGEDIHNILLENDVRAYTEMPLVYGMGELGRLDDSRHRPGHNCSLFAVLTEDRIAAISKALKLYCDKQRDALGRPIGLRAFALPCEQLL